MGADLVPGNNQPDPLEVLADGAVTVTEAVRFSGLSRATLYATMSEGGLAYIKRGRRRLIPRRALVAWLADGLVARRHNEDKKRNLHVLSEA